MGFKKTCGHTKQNTVQRKKKDVISATVKFSFFSAELFDQNCLKYKVFHDMSAPLSRIKSKAEIANQKTHY